MTNSQHDYTLPPFPGFPSVNRYVAVGPVMESAGRIARSILAREAISVVIGPPGTGKSLLCALLAQQFSETHEVVVVGETAIADEAALQRLLLHRLGVTVDVDQAKNLELMLDDHLKRVDAKQGGILLIVDEAASLSENVLEAIRRVTNIMRHGQPVISAVLAGGVKLDETLTSPSLEPFVQRISARCYLHPLNGEEARTYIRQAIEACGSNADETITGQAMSAIFHATSGVPRLINQIMTEAIDCAAEMDESTIDEHTIDHAWSRLQQLPGPMTVQPDLMHESPAVEFGELTDDSTATKTEADSEPELTLADTSTDDRQVTSPPSVAPAIKTPAPLELFGDFEYEERIELAAATSAGGAAKADDGQPERDNTDATCDSAAEAVFDLEAALHSEIIGLSHDMADHFLLSDGEFPLEEGHPDDIAESVEPDSESIEETLREVPAVIWYDEPEPEASPAAESTCRDDSDLLFITEDLDLEPREQPRSGSDEALRVDSASSLDPPKLDVDYREILARMRHRS
ncbi:AAA family ATPase [Roseiconus nitratireducens]|uniref:AAA family ATPase n=1 Tax=Roseiconus nitratireducens TaxID=2605748 RepID=A0A5M6CZI2_9BACT|nr:AAA family ATPase [Roseiconus nitratireducens]KAA5540648.1 AAA family ATPase [Roseiconus nitratireducens]